MRTSYDNGYNSGAFDVIQEIEDYIGTKWTDADDLSDIEYIGYEKAIEVIGWKLDEIKEELQKNTNEAGGPIGRDGAVSDIDIGEIINDHLQIKESYQLPGLMLNCLLDSEGKGVNNEC